MQIVNLAVSSASFAQRLRERRMALEDVPGAVKELGIGAVEIDDAHLLATPLRQRAFDLWMRRYFGAGAFYRAYTSTRLLRLHRAFEDSGVRLAAWRAHTDFILTGRAARWQMNYLEGAIAVADDFGSRLVCIQSGGSGISSVDAQARCVEGLSRAAELAGHFHTRLALESGSGLAHMPGRMGQLLSAVNSPYLAACLEFDQTGAVPATDITYVRALSRAFDPQGRETHIDYPAGLNILDKIDYRGWITIQYVGDGDPVYGIMQTAELISAARLE